MVKELADDIELMDVEDYKSEMARTKANGNPDFYNTDSKFQSDVGKIISYGPELMGLSLWYGRNLGASGHVELFENFLNKDVDILIKFWDGIRAAKASTLINKEYLEEAAKVFTLSAYSTKTLHAHFINVKKTRRETQATTKTHLAKFRALIEEVEASDKYDYLTKKAIGATKIMLFKDDWKSNVISSTKMNETLTDVYQHLIAK